MNEQLKLKYEASLKHLMEINRTNLSNWGKYKTPGRPFEALNKFYKLNPLKEMDILLD